MYDAVVIGAGMSGLGAGIRLAHFGKQVCVLERHCLWGGLNSFYKKEGHAFDVGLHAMTNFALRGVRGPLNKICRQLRLDWDELALRPQARSSVWFPSASLVFSNEPGLLESEVDRAFPGEADGFRRLVGEVGSYDDGTLCPTAASARDRIRAHIREPLLENLLLCPLLFYGSATEGDMPWHQFVILFKAIYLEGFCRPDGGVRRLLDILRREYLGRGGELRLKTGVARLEPGGDSVRVHLENGETLAAHTVLSSAGKVETARLLGAPVPRAGVMTFVESIFCVDQAPAKWGWEESVRFFSTRDDFQYRPPEGPVDLQSGILCCPTNFSEQRQPPEPMVRVTHIARYDIWKAWKDAGGATYLREKRALQEAQLDLLNRWMPDLPGRVRYRDTFTPATVEHFTSHVNGAVYGAPEKSLEGTTGAPGVYLCGTDQGYLGIVGALLSGIVMANRYGLKGD